VKLTVLSESFNEVAWITWFWSSPGGFDMFRCLFFELKLFLRGRTGYLEVLNPCFAGK